MYRTTYYATPPSALNGASTQDLRGHYLVSNLFVPGAVTLNYIHQERIVIGGAVPLTEGVRLPSPDDGKPFLDRRELGVINIGESGAVMIDGQTYMLGALDALYIGAGARDVIFSGPGARYYLASTPAHSAHETRFLPRDGIDPLLRGEAASGNDRAIYQFITPKTCASAQLLMGLTLLRPGSVWNTLPPHLHDRRSEIYFYFDMKDDERLFHFMGPPGETRHIVVANEEAVICPPWSLHMGVGMARYAFIWAMGGENLDYGDMRAIDINDIK